MQAKHFRAVSAVVVLILICTCFNTERLPAQQNANRVGNISVQGGTNRQATVLQPLKSNAPASNVPGEARQPANVEAEQLRKLSDLTPPPRPETAGQPSRQPTPVMAETTPAVAQQAQRAGTRASQSTGTTPAKPETKPAAPAQTEVGADTAVDVPHALELYRRGDFEQAKKMLEEICQKDPKLPPPGIFMVQFAATTRQNDRVRFWLDQATWNYPNDPEAFILLAEFAINDNRLTEAKLLADKGVSLLGNIAANEERHKAVETLAESVQGTVALMRGDWETARSHYEKLTAGAPDNSEYLDRLGLIAAQQGQYEKAIDLYQRAIAKGAKLPTPKLIVSRIASQQGKTDVADKYFAEVMKATDVDPESIRLAVSIQLNRGDIGEADKFLARAIEAEPNNLDNFLLAGRINLFKRDYPAAEKCFQDAILISPNNYIAVQGLALSLAEQNEPLKKERALAYAKNNVQRSGESLDSVATLAWVYFKSDQLVEAEYLVNLILNSGELTPLDAYYLAEITAAVKQTDKALLLVKIATGSKGNFMKRTEAEALQKKLESELDNPAPAPAPETDAEPQTPPPVRIPGTTRN